MRFPGCIPAVTTPFTQADEVDHDALRSNVEHLLANGCGGFVATGTMGEAPSLSHEERRAVVHGLDIGDDAKARLRGLTPATDVGLADGLVDYLG